MINVILKFFIETIANDEKNLSDEYIRNFNEIINKLSDCLRIYIDQDIIDKITNMGGYTRNSVSRRYSVYFCCSIIRV